MKSRKSKIVLTVLIILAAFSLTSCDDLDSALAEKVIMAWLSDGGEVNIYQVDRAVSHLVQKAVNQSVERVTNSDESIQFDALDVVEEMGAAENMAKSALEYLDTARMASAVKMRPDDWRFQEMDAAVWLANGNETAALTAFNKSDRLLHESLKPGSDCPKMRLQQLQNRKQTLVKAEVACAEDPQCSSDEQLLLEAEIYRTDSYIETAAATGSPAFCEFH